MANIGYCYLDVELGLTMSETSKQMVRKLVAEVMEETSTVFPTEDKLRAFIRTEVRKALAAEIKTMSSNVGRII